MRIDIVSAFPEIIQGALEESILRRALERKLFTVKLWDLRDFTTDKHRTVDDYPYGGGPGMILKPEPFFLAVDAIREETSDASTRVIYMTPQGERYTQDRAQDLAGAEHLVLLCGHYRGVDERVVDTLVTDEISIGDYVLTGGELPAAVVMDSVVRMIPGVLGDFDSARMDSFQSDCLDHPHYTRPEVFRGMRVPEVLLSGHHANVSAWRKEQALKRTRERRRDLLENRDEDQRAGG